MDQAKVQQAEQKLEAAIQSLDQADQGKVRSAVQELKRAYQEQTQSQR